MTVKSLFLGRDIANCYILDDGENVVVIDPGAFSGPLAEFAAANRGRIRMVICTHGHFDHICGLYELKRFCPDLKIVISAADAEMLHDPVMSLAERFGFEQHDLNADILLSDGQTIGVGDISLRVMATPGHTPGCITLIDGEYAFTGDTLFRGTIGRCDLDYSDTDAMRDSLRRLIHLYKEEGNRKVMPGHGLRTTLEHEVGSNPFLLELA